MKVRLRNPDREVRLQGPRRVREILGDLSIHPDTVLVIRGGALLTEADRVEEQDEVEIRPVISGGARRSSRPICRRCRSPAVIELPQHNAAFCEPCFLRHFRLQVEKAVERHEMIRPDDRVLVAVSGGKDSLALWDVLLETGHRATGMYLGLGIEDYSDRSWLAAAHFAEERGAPLIPVDLRAEYGFDIPIAGSKGSRSTCAVCGLSKRYVFNRVALDRRFDVVATGHNLDDEAATLLGNTLRWQTEYIARQYPVLDSKPGMVKKVKPLYRLSEKETAAYAFLRRIEYVVEECPLVAGNTQMRYKLALNQLEAGSPGTKASFYFGYLDRVAGTFRDERAGELTPCEQCAQPTTGHFCAFCRARAQITGDPLEAHAQMPVAQLDSGQATLELSSEVMPAEIYSGGGVT